ncbi:MAG: cytochrome C, partial [Pseudomonadota bacterium]
MKKTLTLAGMTAIAAIFSSTVLAGPPAPKVSGIESKDYQWAKMEGEMKAALAVKGEAKKGE